MIYRALSIAGSDSGGGAGIQADLKTWMSLRVFGTSAITAVTAQNTKTVDGIYPIPLEGIALQIDAVVKDIGIDAVKTGMLGDTAIIEVVASKIKEHQLPNLVVDPVMVAKSGARLLRDEAREAMIQYLLPLATIVTPNIPEAEALTGLTIRTAQDVERAAKMLVHEIGAKAAIVKGGHLEGEPIDRLYDGQTFHSFRAPRFDTRHTHGTGCTFSAAITAGLAKGLPLVESVQVAKKFITSAISDELGIGGGHGPTNHWAYVDELIQETKGAEWFAQLEERSEFVGES